ncbi:LOW QUALITY PROTEIN: histone-lysine N-methyltransferase, H3 lysine-9 specific SUVH1-like [Carica papaya]|uniref:LOW QUALITY PROTEIN: histone-lysine N-methyltransferase, H3 lysine-9 specific SUVH1-like n=1 Tax=Carica papaya TaxID=3649 RepID=UPI000B8D1663|nr:LOW QUALITY PROTEIN: histone-lysine N-methyltransferase, H3 lysine-9 specific SUVH1-like [Carica papaya]
MTDGAGSGVNVVPPSNHFDKNRVLDVKPLRCLMPVFPIKSQASPFYVHPPFGLFSSGFLPFYPFNAPEFAQTTPDLNETQTSTLQFPIPLQAFRTPQSHLGGASSLKKRGNEKRNRAVSMSTFKEKVSAVDFDSGISSSERDDGNIEVVNNVLMRFDVVRRRLSQLEKVKEALVGLLRRADLKASNILMGKGVRTNMKKTIGIVPGVEVIQIFFFFQMEICLVGLHSQTMGGIDYMVPKAESSEEPIAINIVLSGGYDDDAEDTDVLIYSGQGGNTNKKDGQTSD